MVEQIDDMPAGTLGFRISGKLTRDEYFQLLDPVVGCSSAAKRSASSSPPTTTSTASTPGALWEDVEAAGSVGLEHRDGVGAASRS